MWQAAPFTVGDLTSDQVKRLKGLEKENASLCLRPELKRPPLKVRALVDFLCAHVFRPADTDRPHPGP